MAYFYSLAIECGTNAGASSCADHFSGPNGSGADVPVEVSVRQAAEDDAWWVVVVPSNESTSGVVSDEVARSLSAAGHALLDRLRAAPPFRFAVIGVEAYEAISFGDLDAALGMDPALPERFHGLVVSDEVLSKLGDGAAFEPFAPGYSWIPYHGEQHRDAG